MKNSPYIKFRNEDGSTANPIEEGYYNQALNRKQRREYEREYQKRVKKALKRIEK